MGGQRGTHAGACIVNQHQAGLGQLGSVACESSNTGGLQGSGGVQGKLALLSQCSQCMMDAGDWPGAHMQRMGWGRRHTVCQLRRSASSDASRWPVSVPSSAWPPRK